MRLKIERVNGRFPKGVLKFRNARPVMVDTLKSLYDRSWGNGVTITREQLLGKMRNFPEGQIVGFEGDKPVSMVNMMVTSPQHALRPGYADVTGNMTFSTHMPAGIEDEPIKIALCVSVAVLPECQEKGYAVEILDYTIALAETNGLIAMPYSAPRGFASARQENPDLDIRAYLHMTKPSRKEYWRYSEWIERINKQKRRITKAFALPQKEGITGRNVLLAASRERYEHYQNISRDSPLAGFGETAFARFLQSDDAKMLGQMYGRELTIEDFCLLTGRSLVDSTARLHVGNGARFIRDLKGGITAVFRDSRPEDTASAGYNMVLTYGYHPALGHAFAARH